MSGPAGIRPPAGEFGSRATAARLSARCYVSGHHPSGAPRVGHTRSVAAGRTYATHPRR
jgi:hypothetical protein